MLSKTKSIFVAIFLLLATQNITAQVDTFFIATKNDSLFFSNDYKQIEERYNKNIDAVKGDYKKEFKEIYKERFEYIKHHFTEKKLLTNATAQAYLKQLLNEIISNNSLLQEQPINIFFNKTEVPNATFVGENTVFFNTGLFERLQNESQVVFVLCHELSHFYLDHSNKQIEKYITTVNSKEFQAELKSIKKAEYKQRERVEKLALGLKFDNRKHSRYKESEADSLAIVFMSKTKFDIREAVGLLEILDGLDKDSFNTEKCLQTTFNSNEFPFQKKWIEKEEGLLGGHAVIKEDTTIADSIKTHPDCKKRIEAVKRLFEKYPQGNAQKSFLNAALFSQFKQQFKLENIAFYTEKKYLSSALYYALIRLSKEEPNPYLITTIGNLFNEFYAAQKTHQLGKYTGMPSPDFDASYNLLLQFIQNLNLDDYKNIGYHFLKKYQNQYSKFIQFTNTVIEAKKI